MKKKIYQSPQMKVVECQMEHQLLVASNETYEVGSQYGDYDFDEN